MAAQRHTREQAVRALEQLEEGLRELPERWLPHAAELRDFADRWERAWNSHSLDALESMITEDVTWEDPAMFGQTVHGRPEFRAFADTFFRAFPDVYVEGLGAPHLSLEGAGMALRTRMIGTFTGDLVRWGQDPAPPSVPPTGRRFDIGAVELYEFQDGLVSHWTIAYDLLAMSAQLGLSPGN
jgi:predicted ester cyclase